MDIFKFIVLFIFRTIKFFSRYKKEEAIRDYVNKSFKSEEDRIGFYIRNVEISIIEIIEEGIFYFTDLKQKEKNNDE